MTFGRQANDEVANLNPRRERRKDVDVLFEDVPLDDAYGDFYPGAGDDVMDARGTGIGRTSAMRIHIHPEEGDDRVFGGLAYMHAHLERKAGRDLFVAGRAGSLLGPGPGPDIVRGGPGPDTIRPSGGRDEVSGGAGNDRIETVDRTADDVRCGPGDDIAIADRRDRLRDCETVRRG